MTVHPRHDPNNASAPLPVPMPNWAKLSPDDDVTIHHHGEEIASGRIDMLAHDGSMLWLIQNGGRGRALFLYSGGGKVFRHPGSASAQKTGRTPRTR